MANKRGPKGPRLVGLRWHSPSRRWYRTYDGKRRYFSPRGTDKTDPLALSRAEREWHLYEIDHRMPAFVPPVDAQQAERLLRDLLPVDEDQITEETVKQFRLVLASYDRQEQLRFLTGLGVPKQFFLDNPDVWDKLPKGSRINPKLPGDDYLTVLSSVSGIDLSSFHSTGPTVQEVIDYYLAFLKKNRRPSHYVDAFRRLPHFVEFVGAETKVSQLDNACFVTYRDEIWSKVDQGEWKPSYGNKALVLVKSAFNRWQKDKGFDNPEILGRLASLETRSGGQAMDIRPLTPAQVKRLLKPGVPLFWRIAVLLGLNIGASNEDINSARWDMIDWHKGTLDFQRGKNSQPRRIPLWSRTLKLLKLHRQATKANQTGYIFVNARGSRMITYGTSKKGKPTKKDNVSLGFSKAARALGMEGLSWRVVRKSTATAAKTYGADEGTVEMILGDAPAKIWKRYVMPVPEVVSKAIASVEAHYFGSRRPRSSTPADHH